jgi:undecaprenyl-diphosphatase
MLWASAFGNWKFVIGFALALTALFWVKHKRDLILPFFISLAGTESTVETLKLIVQRARPIGGAFLEHSHSFPSGHSAISVALYGFLAFILMKQIRNKFEKTTILVASILIILLIGLSRIYLGAHYPTDVMGGFLVGAVWLWLAIRSHGKFNLKFLKN